MNRLRSYRFVEGLSQEELGDILGISASMVSSIENGRRGPNVDLTLIGYGNERLELPSMSEPMHRHKAAAGSGRKARARELLRLAGEVFGELLPATPKAPMIALERLTPPTSMDDLEDIATDARYVLRQEQNGPIRNLTSSVERVGVCLIPIVGLTGIDGVSSWVEDVPVIGLDPAVPGDRFRFSLAHEIAHLSIHIRPGANAEHEANRFAGALLIPAEDFDAAMPPHPQLKDFTNLKRAWGVSVGALVYRAHELGYVDDARYRALQIQMSKWRRNEPARFDPAHGTLLPRLVEHHGGIVEVAAKLGVNRSHLAELVNWSPRRLRAV